MTKTYSLTVDGRELATILAALRNYQSELTRGGVDYWTLELSTNGGEFSPMCEYEVEDLVDKVNNL